jgi:hypothetical protein
MCKLINCWKFILRFIMANNKAIWIAIAALAVLVVFLKRV